MSEHGETELHEETELRSAPSEDEVVEAMARAMYAAMHPPVGPLYPSPDDPALISAPDCIRGVRSGKAWELYAPWARAQFKAYQAMIDIGSGKVVSL